MLASKLLDEKPPNTEHVPAYSFYTESRLAVGLGPAIVVGLNAGEALDFAAGWLGVDLFEDDATDTAEADAVTINGAN